MELLRAGRTLFLRKSGEPKPHPWLVLTDPDTASKRFVAVMVRTVTRFTDDTVTLNPGDHPFVRHESSIHYSTADFFTTRHIESAMTNGTCHLREDMSPRSLKTAREGLLVSKHTVKAVKDFCREQFKL